MNRAILYSVCLLSSALWLGGCSEPSEENNPLFQKGEKAKRENRFEDAKIFFTDYLRQHPESWRAHRILGGLYYEELDRPEYAIYHFEQSILLNPRSDETPKLQSWCEEARHQLYNQLKRDYAQRENAVRQQMETELIQLRRTVEQLKLALEQLRNPQPADGTVVAGTPTNAPAEVNNALESVAKLEEQRRLQAEQRLADRLNRNRANRTPAWELPPEPLAPPEIQSQASAPVSIPSVNPVNPPVQNQPVTRPDLTPPPENRPPPRNVNAGNENVPEAIRSRLAPGDRVHRVKGGETLSSIAQQYYGSRSKYTLIQQANPKLKGMLRVGMLIKIPAEKNSR